MTTTNIRTKVLLKALIERYRTTSPDTSFGYGMREGLASAIAIMAGVYDMPDVDPAGRDAWYAALERACRLDGLGR